MGRSGKSKQISRGEGWGQRTSLLKRLHLIAKGLDIFVKLEKVLINISTADGEQLLVETGECCLAGAVASTTKLLAQLRVNHGEKLTIASL